MLITSVASLGEGTWLSAYQWSVANLVSFAVLILLVLAFRFSKKRGLIAQKTAPWAMLLIAFSLGSTKTGLTLFSALWIFGLPLDMGDLPLRLIGAGIVGIVAILLVAAFVDARVQVQTHREEFIASELSRGLRQRATLQEDRSYFEIDASIRKLADTLRKGNGDLSKYSPEILLLSELGANSVRPLSHRLLERLEDSLPKLGWRDLLESGSKGSPPAGFVALLNLVAIPGLAPNLGLGGAILLVGLASLICFGILTLAGFFTKRLQPLSITGQLLLLVFGVVGSYVATWLILGESLSDKLLSVVSLTLWLVQSALSYIVVRELLRARKSVEALAKGVTSSGLMSADLDRIRSQRGRLLHGQVQSRMMSIALRASSGPGLHREIVTHELDLISQALSEGKSVFGEADFMPTLSAQWDGFLDIKSSGLELVVGEALSQKAALLVEEAISNAYRHGLASEVSVRFFKEKAELVLEVRDNGLGPTNGRPGGGTKLLNEIASSWELSAQDNGGSLLKIIFSN